MICPNCKCEYKEGFFECADCKLPLVYALPEEKIQKEELELLKVFSTRDPALLALIQSILESENIPHFVVGDVMMTSGVLSGGRAADILVDSKALIKVKNLIESINWKYET